MNDNSWIKHENGYRIVRSTARTAPGCHQGCGVLLYTKDGKLEKVRGNPEFPFSEGKICPRCSVLPEVIYHPDRLLHPLKRAGKKGEDRWEQISWEEAYTKIADKLNSYKTDFGAESVIFCTGTQRDIASYMNRMATAFGSPHSLSFGPLLGHACFVPRIAASMFTCGGFPVADCSQYFEDRWDNPEWKQPETIIIWGKSPAQSNSDGFLGGWISRCLQMGSRMIVIDPRKTVTASKADSWLQLRPGTDGALAMGFLHIIIKEKLYDADFVENWTLGFDELKIAVTEYTPNKTSEITWIPAQIIIEAARDYARASPGLILWGVAVDQSKECIPAIHAILALKAITGNLDTPGGNVFTGRNFEFDAMFRWNDVELPPSQRAKAFGIDGHPFLQAINLYKGDEVLEQMLSAEPYPIKAAWIQGTNTFVCGSGDSKRTYEAFKNLDFTIVVDVFMTPTAMAFADIVLPAAAYPEKDGIAVTDGANYLATINKAIEPPGECRPDAQIILELGKKLNPSDWPWENTIEMFDYMLERTGFTFAELRDKGWAYDSFSYRRYEKGLLRPDGRPGFNTPSGKVELSSSLFRQWGLSPVPYYEEPPESPVSTPDLFTQYPLILTTGGKTKAFFHSEQRQIKSLRKMNPDPLLEIHPDTAVNLGITNGDSVYIENAHGKCIQKAKLTEGIHPKVVHAQHGWWFPEKTASEPELFGVWEANINLLLPKGWTGRSGLGYPFKSQICKVYKKTE